MTDLGSRKADWMLISGVPCSDHLTRPSDLVLLLESMQVYFTMLQAQLHN